MGKRAIAPKEGAGVRLRLLEETDLSTTRAWRNQDHIRVWFNNPQPIDESMHLQWWRKYVTRDDDYTFVIEMLDPNLPVGQVALYDVNCEKGEAEYGRCIIGEARATGRNMLYHASKVIIEIARNDLHLNRLYLNVKKDNAKAIHIYKKLGFDTFREDSQSLFMDLKIKQS
jgi:diamine N-acetyltransferase